ncbi:ABC transporter permease [Chryseotalea sanaruensis]|uniref:ABC transporter permease n=2 Tax=Chryseotalea sanaruensis TaxID=2482724 RepID=A0A401U656_9BACT|nr:ABC transporter permease [Chryseotalea sanaruensis]
MMRSRVRTVIDSEVSHIQIHHKNFKDDFDPALVMDENLLKDSLRSVQGIQSIAYRAVTQGMLSTATGSAGVQINGIKPADEVLVSSLNTKIIEGQILNEETKSHLLIGKKLADKLKVKLGSKVVLTFTDQESNMVAGAFRIVGIYQTINAAIDELNIFVNQQTLNTYLGLKQTCHEVAIRLHRDEDVEQVKLTLQSQFPQYVVESWRECSPETDLMVSTLDQYSAIIIVIIMIALAFGIINTMLMSVLERTREIGMLTALGMNRPRVFLLILLETVMLTLVGVPLGLFLSWITLAYFQEVGIDISSFSGAAMSGFGFSSMIFPEFPSSSLLMVMMIVISTALLAAIFPSLKAIKLQPADALRQ